ncbi:hypothetical protein PLICRDRAFT_45638 [Plicaturopsis crispa FD-325 SS-3]|uniref:HNH nuclease domain-containing protein n=1 Tax=Plicaturopsis crispa FD-325 SS-3 TaxID=944288 RepID=A0A0C9SL43_PLICR|nr:hypothetical protein PLICRDRAFT_45638 [Plicaturopsis crispa FD-325 SS-3]
MAPSGSRLQNRAPRPSYPSNSTPRQSSDSPPLTATPPRQARKIASLASQSSQSESTDSTTSTQTTTVEAYVPRSVVARLKKLDPDGPRCLVTNKSVDIDFAYCVPRDLDPSTLERLEYSWNLKPQTLNTDTRYNIFPLNRHLHRLFDSDDWILLPSEEVIRSYIEMNGRMPIGPDFPHQPDGMYEYTLIAKKTMVQHTIHRAQLDGAASDQDVAHTYPFRTLGLIKSHINPCFALWNAGKKIAKGMFEFNCAARKLYEDDKSRMMLALELHVRVVMLYKRWSFYGVPLPPLPGPHVDVSAGTPSISSSRVTRRRRAAPPPPRISNDDGPRLNARTLRAHKESFKDQQVPWTTTIWQWILSYQHAIDAIDAFGMDSLPPDTMDEDGDEEDIPDNYEFYLANDEHDVPDLLRFSHPRERLPSISGDVCFTPLPSTLDLQPPPVPAKHPLPSPPSYPHPHKLPLLCGKRGAIEIVSGDEWEPGAIKRTKYVVQGGSGI